MTKNTKIAAIVSAAALLAIGASMTSFAATGWQEEDGTWVYYDKYEDKVTDTWEKSGSNWYYLNDDGEMATEVLIEDDDNYYYVDAYGAMVTNNWVEMDNSDDDDEDAAATVWYYFQANGKAYKSGTNGKTTFRTINGKRYAFDDDGKMLWGWVDEQASRLSDDDGWKTATYYLGGSDDGAEMYNSWGQIHVIDSDNEDDEDQDYWFYFGSNGHKYAYDKDNGFYEKNINGKKYTFAVDGHMLSAFVASGANQDLANNTASVSDAGSASVNGIKYFRTAEDGARYTKGWFRVVPDAMFDEEDSEEDGEDNARWFYADGQGKLYTKKIKSINGKKYVFDDNGEMLAGVRYLYFDPITGDLADWSEEIDDSDKLDKYTDVAKVNLWRGATEKDGLYAFGDEETDGAMKTGAQTITIDGDAYSFLFKTSSAAKGVGTQGKKDNAFYINGRKVKADSDNKYEIYIYSDSSKVMTKLDSQDVKQLMEDQDNYVVDNKYYGYKGNSADPSFVNGSSTTDLVGDEIYVVLGTSGQYIKSGTKKDGNDYKIVVKDKGQLCGIYVDRD